MAATDNLFLPAETAIYVAPFGTALPATEDEVLPGSTWVSLGFTAQGVTMAPSTETYDVEADESTYPIDSRVTKVGAEFSMTVKEWKQANIKLAFGGGTFSEPTPGHFIYDPPQAGAPYEISVVYDFSNRGSDYRMVLKRCTPSKLASPNFTRKSEAVMDVSLKVLDPADGTGVTWRWLTNNTAWSAANAS